MNNRWRNQLKAWKCFSNMFMMEKHYATKSYAYRFIWKNA